MMVSINQKTKKTKHGLDKLYEKIMSASDAEIKKIELYILKREAKLRDYGRRK